MTEYTLPPSYLLRDTFNALLSERALETQAPRALEVYTAATGHADRDGPASDVVLTGHSFGGGLAA